MASSFDNSRIVREQQHLFINNVELSGIQSVSVNFNDILVPIRSIGMTNPAVYPIGVRNGQVNINYLPFTRDILLPYTTGLDGFNGYILRSQSQTGENYSFNSGYITSYNSKCYVGAIPDISVGISVLGAIGRLSGDNSEIISNFQGITGQTGLGVSHIPTFSSIDLTIDNFDYNRILNYELGLNISRNPIYSIGNPSPISVDINYPIEVYCNLTLDVNDYMSQKLSDYPCKTRVNNLILSLKDHQSHQEFLRYSFDNLILIGQNYNTTIDGNVNMNLQYKTYLGRPTGSTLVALPECISFTGTTGITLCNTCPTGSCSYNSGLMYNCSDTTVINDSILLINITNNDVTYGTLTFEYDNSLMTCIDGTCISDFKLTDFTWNYDYIDISPSIGTILKPTDITFDCHNTQCHTFPFTVPMEGCELNLCVTLPDKRFCPTTTTTTTTTTTPTTTTTTTPTTTTTTTTEPPPTTTTTTTTEPPTTTTTTTTDTTTTTTTTTSTTTTTTTTTPTTTTTTTTTTLPPCPTCDDYGTIEYECMGVYSACTGPNVPASCNCLAICLSLQSLAVDDSVGICQHCLDLCGFDLTAFGVSCGMTFTSSESAPHCGSCCDDILLLVTRTA